MDGLATVQRDILNANGTLELMVVDRNRRTKAQSASDTDLDELYALRCAVEAPVRPEDLRTAMEVYIKAALGQELIIPSGYKLIPEPTATTRGLTALLFHFLNHGWHGDNVTAMGLRIRQIMEILVEYDWVAINLFHISEDHTEFFLDPRLVEAAASVEMHFDMVSQTSRLDREAFIKRLLDLMTTPKP